MASILTLLERKLSDLATITTGLVIKRKQAEPDKKVATSYKMLTLKSFDQNGFLNSDDLEIFESSEVLDDKYLTQSGDVIVRLSSPNTAIMIDDIHEGLLIPSLFVVIRLNTDEIMPEYLKIYLNSDHMKKYYAKSSIGSAIQIIKTGMLREVAVRFPSLDRQEMIIKIDRLVSKEKILLEQLLEEKSKYHDAIINKMLQGGFKHDH